MPDQPAEKSVAAMIDLAIQAENAAERLYHGLAERYAHVPPVAAFWQGMMQDEAAHARGLDKIRGSLTPQQLAVSADPALMQQARKAASYPAEQALQEMTTLEQAYQATHELEYSEMNTVFEFVVSEYLAEDTQRESVLAQLREHIARLREFPEAFRILPS